MLYSAVGLLALVLNLILHGESFKGVSFQHRDQDKKQLVFKRYTHFLMAANCYFVVDIAWGFLYAHHEIPGLYPFLYSDTVLYFVFMLTTMLMWARYVVAYLDKSGRRSIVLLHGIWVMFLFGLGCLVVNLFYPFVFIFTDSHVYTPQSGRHIVFAAQIAFYAFASVYMLYIASKSSGQKKVKHLAVAFTGIVMGIFLLVQIQDETLPAYAMGLIIGISVVHSFVELGDRKEKAIHDRIAEAMAADYEVIYCIDLASNEYLEYSESTRYRSINVPSLGRDFFSEAKTTIEEFVYEDDIEYALKFYDKEFLLKNLEDKHSFSYKYRVLVNGVPRYFLFTVMRSNDNQFLIFYEKDIENELMAEKKNRENQKKTITFSQIAEGLASNYDVIYYVNIANASFVSYEVNNIYGQLEINKTGDDFFTESYENIPQLVHKQDRDQLVDFLNKDYLITTLESQKGCSIDYRMVVSGKNRYTRLSVRETSDKTHFIIGVENIDAEVKKEKQRQKELKTEKELARRDELTGIKNKTAYKELLDSVQSNMDNSVDYLPFALLVCDANNLKQINDTKGHAAGDEYIKECARILCEIFVHSPVFRVGGDEFVVFLRGSDYVSRMALVEKLRNQVLENQRTGTGAVLASGMSEYNPDEDNYVIEIFDRADEAMYKNKQSLKALV